MQQENRLEWIDIAKGMGMILVIMGHCFNKETPIHNWIFSFHMPLFFLLSGYCFRISKYETVWGLVKDKSRTLLIPYIKFWILGLLITCIVPEWRSGLSLGQLFIDVYSGYPSSLHITSTWYLVALFMCLLILYIIIKLGEHFRARWFVWMAIGLSGVMGYMVSVVKSLLYDPAKEQVQGSGASATFLPGNRLPLTLDTCMTALVFVFIGYLLKTYKQQYMESNKRVIVMLALLAVNILVALKLNTRVNLHGCSFGNGFYFYTAALAGTMAVIYLSQLLAGRQNKVLRLIRKFFVFYGRKSLLMLGMQSLGINFFVYGLNKIYDQNYVLYEDVPFAAGWIAFGVITFCFLPIVKWCNDKLPKKVRI